MGSFAAIILLVVGSLLLGVLIDTNSTPSGFAKAVNDGDLDTIRSMLSTCAESEKQEALFYSIYFRNDDAFDLILATAPDLTHPIEWNGAALHIAARCGYLHAIDRLLSLGVDIDQDCKGTPLYWAADAGRDDVVNRLLECGADPGLVNLDWLGRSGFKPNFNTPDDYVRISKLIRNARTARHDAVNGSDEVDRF